MYDFKSYHIQTKVHGLYLIQEAKNKKVNPVLVGFHGYGETAEDQLQLLQNIPGIENWTVCSVQALHPFYKTKARIGYCWMTAKNRELHIQENVNYVNTVISEVKKSYRVNDTVVFHGFSQGTAMACRAALLGKYKSSGVILLGGDIPPELKEIDKMQRILIARGKRDKFYSSIRWNKDIERIQNSNCEIQSFEFNGGHGGHEDYFKKVHTFLDPIQMGFIPRPLDRYE